MNKGKISSTGSYEYAVNFMSNGVEDKYTTFTMNGGEIVMNSATASTRAISGAMGKYIRTIINDGKITINNKYKICFKSRKICIEIKS